MAVRQVARTTYRWSKALVQNANGREHFRHFPQLSRHLHRSVDDPDFSSIADTPPQIIKVGRRHGAGLIVLLLIPVTAFGLGTWQIYRLQWKSDMIKKLEDRIIKNPLPLPPSIDPSAINEFDHRRVYAEGRYRHDQEMLIGPRIHEGQNGFYVVTPLERSGTGSKILVNRGWIPKKLYRQMDRREGLPRGSVKIEGLLREPWKKNLFTPDNRPDLGQFFFPDVLQMARWSGSEPVWIEETMEPNLLVAYDREAKGIPIGRPAEVNLRNNHTQYIFTWYTLSAATAIMFWMVARKPPSDTARMIRHNKEW